MTWCLTLILLMWRIGWASNNASRCQMGFNQAFKGLIKHEGTFMFLLFHIFISFCFLWSGYELFFYGTMYPIGPGPPGYLGFTITLRYTTVAKIPLDEWSARRTDFYLTTYNTHTRQTSMPPVGFEPRIPTSERPHTHALDRAASGFDSYGS
jgi:hypothetical protein